MELKQNFSEGLLDFREFYLKEDEYDVPIYTKFRDGDEFIFSMKSFDKWIKINAVYELIDEDTNIVFSTKVEMRVVGYYPNSHFFNLIQKFVITVWNEHIAKNSEGEYYILKHIQFYLGHKYHHLLTIIL